MEKLPVFNPLVLTKIFAIEIHIVTALSKDFDQNSQTMIQEIEKAFTAGDHKRIERECHSLKSAAKMLGLERFAESVYQLEKSARAQKSSGELITSLQSLRSEALQAIQSYLKSRAA